MVMFAHAATAAAIVCFFLRSSQGVSLTWLGIRVYLVVFSGAITQVAHERTRARVHVSE